MKNFSNSTSLILAAGLAGVAFFNLANASFTAGLSGDAILAAGLSAAIFGFAINHYSRRPRLLSATTRLLRPALPVVSAPCDRGYGNKNRVAA
jgi:hypothetical protein